MGSLQWGKGPSASVTPPLLTLLPPPPDFWACGSWPLRWGPEATDVRRPCTVWCSWSYIGQCSCSQNWLGFTTCWVSQRSPQLGPCHSNLQDKADLWVAAYISHWLPPWAWAIQWSISPTLSLLGPPTLQGDLGAKSLLRRPELSPCASWPPSVCRNELIL